MNRPAFSGGGFRIPCWAAASTSCLAASIIPSELEGEAAELCTVGFEEPSETAVGAAGGFGGVVLGVEITLTGAGRRPTLAFFGRVASGMPSGEVAAFSVGGVVGVE